MMSLQPKVQELAPSPGPSTSRMAKDGADENAKKDTLSRLVEKQLEEIDAISGKIELWTQYRDDYSKLKKLIDKMQDRVRHPHRVPIAGTKLAFVDGHIVHVNELYVLLGDNYFALRSARQSNKIIDRRLTEIQRNLKMSEEAKKKTEDWLKATEEHRREKEEFVEIIETM
uniref:Unconventional prefoldin RPB5 interactor n=1 Tax=Aceria tosichella TaxID=561515 RepID=A0A6G1SHR2_9ACAR